MHKISDKYFLMQQFLNVKCNTQYGHTITRRRVEEKHHINYITAIILLK